MRDVQFNTLLFFTDALSVNSRRRGLPLQKMYVRHALGLARSLDDCGKVLRVFTNDRRRFERLLPSDAKVKIVVEEVSFPTDLPTDICFYAAHHKLYLYSVFSGEPFVNCLLDLDMIANPANLGLAQCVGSGSLLDGWVYDISDHVFPAYGTERAQGDLVSLGVTKPSPRWYGGEFLAGNARFFSFLSSRCNDLLPRYLGLRNHLHQLGGEETVVSAVLNRCDEGGIRIADVGASGVVVRYWTCSTRHIQKPRRVLKASFLWHLPASKPMLTSFYKHGSPRLLYRYLSLFETGNTIRVSLRRMFSFVRNGSGVRKAACEGPRVADSVACARENASRGRRGRSAAVHPAAASRKTRVVYWNNMPSPYVVGRFNALAARGNLDFEAWFNLRREPDRSWTVNESAWQFRGRYLPQAELLGKQVSDPRSALREFSPDLLISLYDSPSFVLGSLAARASGCRTAFRFLPTYDTWIKRTVLKEAFKHVLFRAVDGVKVPGPCGAARVSRYGVKERRIHRVTQTIDLAHFSSARAVTEAERNELRRRFGLKGCAFIYVGRLFEGKGVRHLIEAFGSVRAAEADVSLLILGDGVEEQKYRAMAASIPGIVFGGFVQHADIPRCYAAADVFVFPTLGDPHGLVVEEAMAAGLPVITTSSAGDIELRVLDGIGGYVVPPAKASVLGERMLTLARDLELRRRFAKKGIELVQHRAHEQWAIDFERFVDGVMREPRSINLSCAAAWMLGKLWMASDHVTLAACMHPKTNLQ